MDLYHYLAVAIGKPTTLPAVPTGPGDITRIIGLFLRVFGAIAVLVLVYGGFKYLMSRGDPQATAKAKDTILYAVVGLVVAIVGQVIIAFVFNRVVR